jgi:hypothetical protein
MAPMEVATATVRDGVAADVAGGLAAAYRLPPWARVSVAFFADMRP